MSWVMHAWYVDLAELGHFAQTPAFFDVMHAWQRAEGGDARHNAFNTTQTWPGSTRYNSAGVQNYKSREDGVKATWHTLNNGYYPELLAALRNVKDPYVVADAIGKSPWGTNGYTVKAVLHSMGVPE